MIITLDSDNELDEYKIKMLNNGHKYLSVIYEMQSYLRALNKYDNRIDIKIEELYNEWWEILKEEEVNPYDE